jgi:putative membrane protein
MNETLRTDDIPLVVRVIETEADDEGPAPAASPRIIPDSRTEPVVPSQHGALVPRVEPRRRRFRAFAGAGIAVGLAGWFCLDAINWVLAAFERSTAFGTLAAGALLAGLAGAGALIGRELVSLFRLRNVEATRRRLSDDRIQPADARNAIAGILAVVPREEEISGAIASFQRQVQMHHSASQQVALLSRTVLAPLDCRAEAHVRTAVLRAFGITAISPTALTDAAFFLACGLRMVRGIAASYGHRPTAATTLHLLRRLLIEAGKLGAVDIASASIVQQLGGAVTERIASTTAEALYAAYRMARLGIIVMDLCRPAAFAANEVPSVGSLVGNVLTRRGSARLSSLAERSGAGEGDRPERAQ